MESSQLGGFHHTSMPVMVLKHKTQRRPCSGGKEPVPQSCRTDSSKLNSWARGHEHTFGSSLAEMLPKKFSPFTFASAMLEWLFYWSMPQVGFLCVSFPSPPLCPLPSAPLPSSLLCLPKEIHRKNVILFCMTLVFSDVEIVFLNSICCPLTSPLSLCSESLLFSRWLTGTGVKP